MNYNDFVEYLKLESKKVVKKDDKFFNHIEQMYIKEKLYLKIYQKILNGETTKEKELEDYIKILQIPYNFDAKPTTENTSYSLDFDFTRLCCYPIALCCCGGRPYG
jgi:hypothetical protein